MAYFFNNFPLFLLVMARLSSMLLIVPFFSNKNIPLVFKALICFFLTLVIIPLVVEKNLKLGSLHEIFFPVLLQEIGIGLFIGFVVLVIFTGFQLAGQFFSLQIGFDFSEVIDPFSQKSFPLFSQLKYLIGLLVFLAIDGHHLLIKALYNSYELIPIFKAKGIVLDGLLKYLAYSFQAMFIIALKIALPVMILLFFASVSLGLISRILPQVEIMIFSFPIKIIATFLIIMVAAPFFVKTMQISLEKMFDFLNKILFSWPG